MSFLSGIFNNKTPTASPAFGYTFGADTGIAKTVEEVQTKMRSNNKQIKDKLTQYQQINKFSKQLSDAYIGNLEVMVDISQVLNYYAAVFQTLNHELTKNMDEFSSILKPEDLTYLQKLTRTQLDKLNNSFFSESDKLKKLYQNFGKQEEINRVERAETQIRSTSSSAEATLAAINSPSTFSGGKRRRIIPRFKRTPIRLVNIKRAS